MCRGELSIRRKTVRIVKISLLDYHSVIQRKSHVIGSAISAKPVTASLIVFVPIFKSIFCWGQHSLRAVEAFPLHYSGTVLYFKSANGFLCHNILLLSDSPALFATRIENDRRAFPTTEYRQKQSGEWDESIIPIDRTSLVSFHSRYRAAGLGVFEYLV